MAKAVRRFSPAEKTVFYTLVGLFIFSGAVLLERVNSAYMIEIPAHGGTLAEGLVGNPRFINPVLAFSGADKALSSLIYSGLMRVDENGTTVPDLAESVTVSNSGLIYSVTLKPHLTFHDGAPVTADDVVFTVERILDQNVKSPLYGDWSGVSIEKTGDLSVNFILKKAYAPFLNNLTVGILPKHIWSGVTADEFAFSQFNTLPIGTGPFKIDTVTRNSGGIPDYYDLVPFDGVSGDVPYIGHLIFKFYPTDTELVSAYRSGDIDSLSGISPDTANSLRSASVNVLTSPLPRIFGVFFNQNQNKALQQKEVRQALDIAAPKEKIVSSVLQGYGTAIDSPLPPSLFPWTLPEGTQSPEERLAAAEALLEKNGWQKNSQGILEKKSKKDTITLSFSISTGNAPELKAVAEELRNAWTGLGAAVDVQVFETGELNQTIIRPRRYDALLFGEVVGRDADIYPFWHSSQRNDPGLNIALYANSRADKLLDDIRSTSDASKRDQDYRAFDAEIRSDVPLVSLYSPNFIYIAPKTIRSLSLGHLATPEDRFSNVRHWYIETDNVWKLFVPLEAK